MNRCRTFLGSARNRMVVHLGFAAVWLVAAVGIPFTPLKDSTAYVIFISHVALIYGAISTATAEQAGRKADPEDPT